MRCLSRCDAKQFTRKIMHGFGVSGEHEGFAQKLLHKGSDVVNRQIMWRSAGPTPPFHCRRR